MLYGCRYEKPFCSRKEEMDYQRALVEKLLQWALLREYGLDISKLHRDRTPEGKPFFTDCPVQFNLSHCAGLVCCALSRFPVGVDGECPRLVSERLIERVCTDRERAWLSGQPDRTAGFLSLWTLKESVMKLSGQGIAYGFQNASFTFEGPQPSFCEPGMCLSQFVLPGGWTVSAASWKERFSRLELVDLA